MSEHIIIENIHIENVDVNLLERQRQHLNNIIYNSKFGNELTEADIITLQGIRNMLDNWSDNYFNK